MKPRYRFERLLGQETEYAIRYSIRSGGLRPTRQSYETPPEPRPGHSRIFQAFRYAIKRIVKIRPGEWAFFIENFFTENGGAFNYEAVPQAPESGLIEGATPECRGPLELVLYQRAQEALLVRAIPDAMHYLERRGYPGELALIKNCRDAVGHIYGAQESYETEIARGWRLWLYRAAAPLCMLPVCAWWVTYLILLVCVVVAILLAQLSGWAAYGLLFAALDFPGRLPGFGWLRSAAAGLSDLRDRFETFTQRISKSQRFASIAAWTEYVLVYPITYVIVWPYGRLLHALAFRRERRYLTAFLISRPILSGAGTLLDGDRFALSEKATALRRIFRTSVSPRQRPLFDSGNLHKAFLLGGVGLVLLRADGLRRIFRKRVRLQIGMSDANRAQYAEFLKVGTMLLVLDAADAGYLNDAPRLRSPRRALRKFNEDPGLNARVRTRDGRDMSALEIQEWYLNAVRRFLADRTPDAEPLEVVQLWSDTLAALADDPGKLIGRLDWVSKRYLLETAGRGVEADARKRIDIGYHELGGGYFDRLESNGIAPRLVDPDRVQAAIREPSSPERVQFRSRLIRGVEFSGQRVQISWSAVRVGAWWNQRVISLDEFRKRREKT